MKTLEEILNTEADGETLDPKMFAEAIGNACNDFSCTSIHADMLTTDGEKALKQLFIALIQAYDKAPDYFFDGRNESCKTYANKIAPTLVSSTLILENNVPCITNEAYSQFADCFINRTHRTLQETFMRITRRYMMESYDEWKDLEELADAADVCFPFI